MDGQCRQIQSSRGTRRVVTPAVQSKVYRVEGFRNPTLPDERRRQLVAEEGQPLDLSVESVLRDAREQTSLDDFGPMDFVERIGLLLSEVEANDNLWRSAKAQFRDFCGKAAANRLKNRDFLKRHPEIDDIVIYRPII